MPIYCNHLPLTNIEDQIRYIKASVNLTKYTTNTYIFASIVLAPKIYINHINHIKHSNYHAVQL